MANLDVFRVSDYALLAPMPAAGFLSRSHVDGQAANRKAGSGSDALDLSLWIEYGQRIPREQVDTLVVTSQKDVRGKNVQFNRSHNVVGFQADDDQQAFVVFASAHIGAPAVKGDRQ